MATPARQKVKRREEWIRTEWRERREPPEDTRTFAPRTSGGTRPDLEKGRGGRQDRFQTAGEMNLDVLQVGGIRMGGFPRGMGDSLEEWGIFDGNGDSQMKEVPRGRR